jgi:hypothetical protein
MRGSSASSVDFEERRVLDPFQFVLISVADGWMNQQQQLVMTIFAKRIVS